MKDFFLRVLLIRPGRLIFRRFLRNLSRRKLYYFASPKVPLIAEKLSRPVVSIQSNKHARDIEPV